MAKRILVKLMIVVVMSAGMVLGTSAGADADICIDIWTMRPKPTRICIITADQ